MDRFNSIRISAARVVGVTFFILCAGLFSGCAASAQKTVTPAPAEEPTVKQQDLGEYAGTYGTRQILFSGGKLRFSNERMPMPVLLETVGEDKFELIVPDGAMRGPGAEGPLPTFVFNRNSSGEVESLSLVKPDGSVLSTDKRNE